MDDTMKIVGQVGEQAAIATLTAPLRFVGDDCAVLPQPGSKYDLILTSDPLIQEIHFTVEATPEQIARKAMGRVLSDFAAMGAEPQYLLVNVVAPSEQEFRILEKIYGEFSLLCTLFGVDIVGGDLARGPTLELHVFGVGRLPKGTALLRSGARPGDPIYVTGPLGNAQASGKHLTFMPRLSEGQWLRESGAVTAMLDISDGLGTDLRHLLKASGVGAEIISADIPKMGTLDQALFDGEDFELLFTVHPAAAEGFARQCLEKWGTSFPRIGQITRRPEELLLDGVLLMKKGFEHFIS